MVTGTVIAEFMEQQAVAWMRAEEGRTVAGFADWLGIPEVTFAAWLNGAALPGAEHAAQLADRLGPQVYDLLGLKRPDPMFVRMASMLKGLSPRDQEELMRLVEAFEQRHH